MASETTEVVSKFFDRLYRERYNDKTIKDMLYGQRYGRTASWWADEPVQQRTERNEWGEVCP